MDKRKVNLIVKDGGKEPTYATPQSVGADVYANNENVIAVCQGDSAVIPTGVYMDLPDGMEVQVRPRSGLAAKHKVTVLNAPGTIDPDYQGEFKIILINHGKDKFLVNKGDRIAQLVFRDNCVQADFNHVDDFTTTSERGAGGLGHTGK